MDALPSREEPVPRSGHLWYVTNGELVVGPVTTNLLMRGIAVGKVPDDARIWRDPWPFWRPLGAVREVRALRHAQERLGPSWCPSTTWSPPPASSALVGATRWITSGMDEQEVIGLTLAAAARELRATSGLAHRPERALGSLVVRSVVGESVRDRLGACIPASDSAMRMARMGAAILDRRGMASATTASLDRLGHRDEPSAGVALAPVYFGARLVAILELGKHDRPFRGGDHALLRSFTRVASRCLAER
jgi:hypothetical protein